ncbi:MAG: Crp/Fnr family transcriptional regulator [Pseudomonadota bacterium]
MTFHAFARRLRKHYEVSQADLSALESLPCETRSFLAKEWILQREDPKTRLLILTTGWAVRSRYTTEGQRQIIQILLPGDVLTPDAFVVRQSDHDILALTRATIRTYDRAEMHRLLLDLPSLAAGLWWSAAQEEGMLREHIVRIGRRSARARLAHLLLELYRRVCLISTPEENCLDLPMSQAELADALGLSAVHLNRTLRELQRAGMVEYSGDTLCLTDRSALAQLCDYDDLHLQLDNSADESAFCGTSGGPAEMQSNTSDRQSS